MTESKDRYEQELEEAIQEANIIPKEYWSMICGFRFLGTVQTKHGNMHYYRDDREGKYYCESDFDRHMRAVIKKNRFENRIKK